MHSALVYLNGECISAETASLSPFDRGFLFGDAVYEVIPVYDNKPFRLQAHFERLCDSLNAIGIQPPFDFEHMHTISQQLIDQTDRPETVSLYWQISRGCDMQRQHIPTDMLKPTQFACLQHRILPDIQRYQQGFKAILQPDIRWHRNEIKTTSILANILLIQQARAAESEEAILYDDDQIIEGASSNVFFLDQDTLYTPQKTHRMLSGITRKYVIEIANKIGLPIQETDCSPEQLRHCSELYITSSTREIMPIIQLDSTPIGNGRVGPVWHTLFEAFQKNLTQ